MWIYLWHYTAIWTIFIREWTFYIVLSWGAEIQVFHRSVYTYGMYIQTVAMDIVPGLRKDNLTGRPPSISWWIIPYCGRIHRPEEEPRDEVPCSVFRRWLSKRNSCVILSRTVSGHQCLRLYRLPVTSSQQLRDTSSGEFPGLNSKSIRSLGMVYSGIWCYDLCSIQHIPLLSILPLCRNDVIYWDIYLILFIVYFANTLFRKMCRIENIADAVVYIIYMFAFLSLALE